MQIKYVVHSVTTDEFSVIATVAGKETTAKITGLVVELLSEDGSMGHTYRFVPDDMAAALDEFANGNTIIATFSREG